ncbi:MAG: hypothetical protein ACD_7C00004G0003 [uncultured bacterium]|nr:MAG: hypothetical protein ACD_7C00004G0003 [uncultured bacterium]
MKVLIASHNPGKINRFKNLLRNIEGIEIISLNDIGITDDISEPFLISKENAVHKAKEYGKISGLIVIAIDDSAKTNFLPDNEQPGVFLKRFSRDKSELDDKQIVETWKEIFKKYPQGNKQIIWDSSIAYYNPKNDSIGITRNEKVSYVVDFSPIIPPGYPMGSFLSPEPNGKQYSELTEERKRNYDEQTFSEFIENFKSWLVSETF